MTGLANYRKPWLVCLVGLIASMAWCFAQLTSGRERAQAAVDDLVACQILAAKVDTLRQRPAVAGRKDIEIVDLTRRIDSARVSADMADNSLVRIEPQDPRRVGESAYKEKLTRVMLHQVTAKQYIAFLLAITAKPTGLEVREIRLSSPQDGPGGCTWTADVTLGYLIYAPATERANAG